MITYGQLPDLVGYNGPRPFLRCSPCGGEYSASRGDYWDRLDESAKCCGQALRIVIKCTTYREAPEWLEEQSHEKV